MYPNQNKNIKACIGLFLMLGSMMLWSCKPENDTPIPQDKNPIIAKPSLGLKVNHLANGQKLSLETIIVNNNGERYNINNLRYYMGKIRLVRNDNTEISVENPYQLVIDGKSEYQLGAIDTGSYKAIRFGLGVDSLNNHKDPTTYPKSHPLALQSPSMFWTWNTGYIFMKLEGSVDTTQAQTQVFNDFSFKSSLVMHLGKDYFYREVELPIVLDISKQAATIEIDLNVEKLLQNIDIRKFNFTHSGSRSDVLASGVAQNIAKAFAIHHSSDK
jgi:hypothetical protein